MGYHSYQPGILGGFVIFDLVIQTLAILGNGLVLMAVIHVKIGLVGFRRFLISLLANNIFLCVSQVFIAIYLEFDETIDRKHSCVGTFLDSLKLFAVFAALFNLCGMSLDHLIGIIQPLKYDYLMNTKAAKTAPFFIWIFAFIFAFLDIPIAAVVYYMYSYRPIASGTSYLALYQALINSTSPTAVIMDSGNCSVMITQQSIQPAVTAPMQLPVTPPLVMGDDDLTAKMFQESLSELSSLNEIDVCLLQEETDWCLISHSYKLYWVQWFRLICTVVAFVFLLLCYGRIFGEIRRKSNVMSSTSRALADAHRHQFPTPIKTPNSLTTTPVHGNGSSFSSPAHCHRQSSLMQRRSSKKFIMTTLSLLSVFAICWLPFIILEISVSPDQFQATPSDDDPLSVTKLHLLQHLFNSLFLSYPLLDSIICVIRVCSVRRYIEMSILFPFKCYKSRQFANGQPESSTLITMGETAGGYPKSQSGSGSIVSLNNCANITTATVTSMSPKNNNNGRERLLLSRTLSAERAKANGFIIGATWELITPPDDNEDNGKKHDSCV